MVAPKFCPHFFAIEDSSSIVVADGIIAAYNAKVFTSSLVMGSRYQKKKSMERGDR